MKTLIKNGKIVTEEKSFLADLLIEDGKISQIGSDLHEREAAEEIDAMGLFVLPGGVDVHVHLDLPMAGTISSDDHFTGTRAAAFGGTTTVIDFVSQDSDNLLECVENLRAKADKKVSVDYGLHMNITHLTQETEKQIPLLVDMGVTSIKVFTAYNNRLRLQDGEIFKVLRIAREAGLLTMLHAENGDLIDLLIQEALAARHTTPIWHARTRPAWGAAEALLRGAALAVIADAPLYVVHMNTRGEVDLLQYALQNHFPVYGETCPQYLLFTQDELERSDGAKWICSPPLRTKDDQTRLWEGLKTGLIKTIATDHCPFFYNGKQPIKYDGVDIAIAGKELGKDDFTKIPNGLPGVGDRLPVLWTEMVTSKRFTENEFVALTSANPAKLFGLYPRKGTLKPGSDADIVLWDPCKEIYYGIAYAQHRTDYNLYEGWRLKGYPVQVFSNGKLIVKDGEWYGRPGGGRFIQRKVFDRSLK